MQPILLAHPMYNNSYFYVNIKYIFYIFSNLQMRGEKKCIETKIHMPSESKATLSKNKIGKKCLKILRMYIKIESYY